MRESTSDLLSSLRNTLAYYANTHPDQMYTSVVLSGRGANLRGFPEALGEITRIPVLIADPFARVAPPKQLLHAPAQDRHTFGIALGLALGSAA
jgi:type IV pilus assembly protein PilM